MGSGPSIEVVARPPPPPTQRAFTLASVHGFSDVATALDLEEAHRLVAVGQSDGNVRVCGRAGASVALTGGYADPVLSVHFLDLQGRLVVVHPGAVVLWDLDAARTTCVYSIEADLGDTVTCSFLLRPFGERFVFLGTATGAVFVFDVLKQRMSSFVIRAEAALGQGPHMPGCVAVAANPAKESYVLVAYEDGRMVCFDVEHDKVKYAYRSSGTVRAVAWDAAEGDAFAVGLYEGVLEVWGRKEPEAPRSTVLIEAATDDRDPILDVRWGKQPRTLFVAGGSRRRPGVYAVTLPVVGSEQTATVHHITPGFAGRCMGFATVEDGDGAALVALSDDNSLSVSAPTAAAAADSAVTPLPFPSPVRCLHFAGGPTAAVVCDRLQRKGVPAQASVLQGGIAAEFHGRPPACDGLLVTAHDRAVVHVWWCEQLGGFRLLDTVRVREFIEDEDEQRDAEISRIKLYCTHGTAQLLVGLVNGPCVVLEQQGSDKATDSAEKDGTEDAAHAFEEELHVEGAEESRLEISRSVKSSEGGGAEEEEAILEEQEEPPAEEQARGSDDDDDDAPHQREETTTRATEEAKAGEKEEEEDDGEGDKNDDEEKASDHGHDDDDDDDDAGGWEWALMMMVGHAATVRTMGFDAHTSRLVVGDESGVFTLTDTLRDECVTYQQASSGSSSSSTIVTAVHVGPVDAAGRVSCVYVGLSNGTLRMYHTDGRPFTTRPRSLERDRATKHPRGADKPSKARAVRLIQTFHSSGRVLRCGDAVTRNEERKSGGCLLIVSGKQLHVTEMPIPTGAAGAEADEDRPLRSVAFQLHTSPIQSAAVVERLDAVAVLDLMAHVTLYMLLDLQRVLLDVDLGVVAVPRARLNMATDSCFVDGASGCVFLLSKNGEVACSTVTQPEGAFTPATVYDPTITARLAHTQLQTAATSRLPRQRKSLFGTLFQSAGKSLLDLLDKPMHGGAQEKAREELLAGAVERKRPQSDSAAKGAARPAMDEDDEEDRVDGTSREAADASNRMREAVQRMRANVDKTKEIEDKAERMNEQAANFYDLSKKLAQQQKKKASWF